MTIPQYRLTTNFVFIAISLLSTTAIAHYSLITGH